MPKPAPHRAVGYLLLALALPLLAWQVLPVHQWVLPQADFLALHSLLEVFTVVVSALVFFTGLGAVEAARSSRTMELGGAFLAVGLFDMLHLLAYAGMPDLISPNTPHKAILFWLLARAVAGIGLLAYVLLADRPVSNVPMVRRLWFLAVLLLVLAVAWLPLTAPERILPMYHEGVGLTRLKVALEWGICGLYLLAALVAVWRRRRISECEFGSLLLALLLMAASEVFLAIYVQVSSTANLLGHVYKLVAYYFLYRAIYAEAVNRPFRQMRHVLTHDALTGLPNRAAFGEALGRVLARGGATRAPCAVLLLDLDHFQNVNDTLGHEQGDRLLVAIVARLRENLPAASDVARFSGDEFVILLEDAQPAQARQLGDTLLLALAREFEIGEDRVGISASIGMATFPQDGDTVSALLRHADLALHQAKLAGRNCVVGFSTELDRGFQRRMQLEAGLRHALERGELALHYQPKWEIESGRLAGWEALLRWHSPELGQVRPDEFIPLAERTGLILQVGDWVLREACRQLREWRAQGLPTGTMAVNLSARQFRQRDIAEEVSKVLRETGLAPADLELEITESVLMDDIAAATVVLTDLERLGVRIAIDDFGTGYSSLAYLKSFPIHCLKIDRSFITDIPRGGNDAVIVRSIIALSRSLGLQVVAEGVETQEQFTYLRDNACDQAQGYLFFPPLPPADCHDLLRACRRLAEGNLPGQAAGAA